ncbi:MAG: AraC family transcriptional regulator [Lachnospiraceae bacterium]|nr:helix-turn-helix transcriptional regulator [Lachnospiraceae bacterium]MEE0959618.1 AraC family transcriptional regulator [Lachnospiraceae bacterium]
MQYINYREHASHGNDSFPVAFYYFKKNPVTSSFPYHWHPEWEIIHVISGTLTLTSCGQTMSITSGNYYLVSSGDLHSGEWTNCEYESIVFDFNTIIGSLSLSDSFDRLHLKNNINELISAVRICEKLFELIHSCHSYISSYTIDKYNINANDIHNSINTDSIHNNIIDNSNVNTKDIHIDDSDIDFDNMNKFIFVSYLFAFFGELDAHNFYQNPSEDSMHYLRLSDSIKPALSYIENHYSENISLDDLARTAGFNKRYFCKIFKSLTTKTPIEYLNLYRINIAKKMLLDNSTISVSEVAYACGYNDSAYFIRIFKKTLNTTPAKFQSLM